VTRTLFIAGTFLTLVRSPIFAEELAALAPQPAAEVPAPADAAAALAEAAQPADAAAAPAEAAPPVDTAAATPEGDPRDPFRPFTFDLRPEVPDDLPLTPLQRYELPQLRLAAVLLHTQPARAMVEDNSGMGFIVMPGTPIGRNQGVVKAIESRRVVVEEKTLDYYGNEQIQNVVIEMPQENQPQGDGQQ